MASYDMASNTCLALVRGGRRRRADGEAVQAVPVKPTRKVPGPSA